MSPNNCGQDSFGIYIHWPFCASKCPYCDFNSHVSASIDHESWRKSYIEEIKYYAGLTKGRIVTSIFFGGGTPSLMEPGTVQAVIDVVAEHWDVVPHCEITLEANPTSVETDKFKAFRMAGVNRVSIGVQSLIDDQLKFLGREHSAAEAIIAIKTAAQVFDRYSFDLIYARPEQKLFDWRNELTEALSYAESHMSLYQLTIEQGTPFYTQHLRGDFRIPDNDRAGDFYEETQEIMDKAGLPAYEVSNHAREGQESRHNMTYWQYGDYVGIGPGAHGRLTLDGVKQGTRGHRAPQIWQERVAKSGHGSHEFENIDKQQSFTEALMMGLRTKQGLILPDYWTDYIQMPRLQTMIDEGHLVRNDNHLQPTISGMQRLNGVLEYLL